MASTARSKDRARNNAAIFSVVAIAIIIAIPAALAAMQESSAEYYKHLTSDDDPIAGVTLSPESGSSWINASNVYYDGHTLSFTSDAAFRVVHIVWNPDYAAFFTNHQVSRYVLTFSSSDFDFKHVTTPSGLVTVEDHVNSHGVFHMDKSLSYHEIATESLGSFMFYDGNGVYSGLEHEAGTYAIDIEFELYESKELFSETTIEMIFLISGLLLIFFAMFATPWISVSKVTRTARKGARSVKNGAKKAARSVKRSVKKR